MSELNLIPYSIKRKRKQRKLLIQAGAGTTLMIFILFAGAYYPHFKANKQYSNQLLLMTEIEKESVSKNKNAELRTELDALKKYIDKVDSIKNNKSPVYDILKNMEKYLPSDVYITNLNYDKGNISINATCKQYHSINELLANLQESKEYKNSSVNTIAASSKNGEYTFTLTIKYEKVINK
jgi:Tfp pilus assembly protein PilN